MNDVALNRDVGAFAAVPVGAVGGVGWRMADGRLTVIGHPRSGLGREGKVDPQRGDGTEPPLRKAYASGAEPVPNATKLRRNSLRDIALRRIEVSCSTMIPEGRVG